MNFDSTTDRARWFAKRQRSRSITSRRRLRRLVVETLEDRRLLFNPAALAAGLKDQFLPFVDVASQSGHYQDRLPLLAANVADPLPLKSTLDLVLVTPLANFIAATPNSTAPEVNTWLNGNRYAECSRASSWFHLWPHLVPLRA